MSFKTWLLNQIKPSNGKVLRDDMVTDLAYDVSQDDDFPHGNDSNNYRRIYRYLRRKNACTGAIRAFRLAWLEWIDQDKTADELSWSIPTPRLPNGEWVICSFADLLYNDDYDRPKGEPLYSEEQLERKFRKGYYYGMSDCHDFLLNGGHIRQLRQWYEEIFRWWQYSCCDEFEPPPSPPPPWNETRKIILNRDDKICRYCGAKDAKHVDHIWPLSLGGDDDYFNLVVACKSCNSKKHAKHPYEWKLSYEMLMSNPELNDYLLSRYDH